MWNLCATCLFYRVHLLPSYRTTVYSDSPFCCYRGRSKQLERATNSAINAISEHAQRLAERRAEKKVREIVFQSLPTSTAITIGEPVEINVDVKCLVANELGSLMKAISQGDLETLISRYPVRETPALNSIATQLGFRNCSQYEGAVQKLLLDDYTALEYVRSLFGTLSTNLQGD
jgi:hypothetical protein